VWNQLFQPQNFSLSGVSGTVQSDGTYLFNGVSTTALDISMSTVKCEKDHVYLLHLSNLLTVNGTFILGYSAFPQPIQTKKSVIRTCVRTVGENPLRLFVNPNVTFNNFKIGITFFDLTLMFGAGNEPATVEEFEKMFPLDYYDYNEGEIIPFAGQNLVTTGKNQYNPTTGKANLLGGQTYQIGGTYTSATIDEVAVTLDSNNCFITTEDCVLDVTGGNDTNTFVGLYNGKTNTYEPYEKHTLPLDPSQWRDNNDNPVFPYGGMHGVGTAYDYAKVDADGYIRKVVRCFSQVDLGSLEWIHDSVLRFQGTITGISKIKTNLVIPMYIACNVDSGWDNKDKVCSLYSSRNKVFIKDTAYTDPATFKTTMQGVPLIYELAEPIEVELATPIYAKYLANGLGTEEISPANTSTPTTTPANMTIDYRLCTEQL